MKRDAASKQARAIYHLTVRALTSLGSRTAGKGPNNAQLKAKLLPPKLSLLLA